MPKSLYLIDGSAYIFRAYHSLPMMTRSDGTPVNAVRGFTQMMINLRKDHPSDYFAVVFDPKGGSFRNDIYDLYKANRSAPPEDLVPQFPLVREATRALGMPVVEIAGYEADDLIATYARLGEARDLDVFIVSSDKDLMQLVTDRVKMLDPMKNTLIDRVGVQEKFGVGPEKVIDVQALAGDSSDNVPGVPGIGIKTAAQLIDLYGDLETLLARASEIKQPKRRDNLIAFADQARLSRRLVTLETAVDVDMDIEEFAHRDLDPAVLQPFLQEMEFRTLAERLGVDIAAPQRSADGGGAPALPKAPPLDQCTYPLVTDLAALQTWVQKAQSSFHLAIDTETTSVNEMRARLVGLSLATAAGEACYIPVDHVDEFGLRCDPQLTLAEVRAALDPVLRDPSILKIGHNLKYDLVVLRRHGFEIEAYDDTMLLSFALDGGRHGHGMDELSVRFLGHRPMAFKEVAGTGKNQVTFDKVPLSRACAYAAEDADLTFRFWHLFKPRLAQEGMVSLYETIERPLVPVLADMEQAGIRVDAPLLGKLSNDFALTSDKLESEIHDLAGGPFTIGSPKQLGEVLFGTLGLEGGKKSAKTGAYSTDASVLEDLARVHPLPAKVVEWRQVNKLRSTYTDALQQQVNEATGRVHTSYSMVGAQTGRLSSTDPNLQNIPIRTPEGRAIRGAFIAKAGHKILSADYSQVELRLAAHMAGETALKQAFQDGQDIHAITASQVFNVPLAGMDSETRSRAKAINFGIIYGISAFGLANNLGIGRAEAQAFITAYFARFPGIQDFMETQRDFARTHQFVKTLFGRKIHLPGMADKNAARRSFAERQAINAPIQGTAADIIKRAMIKMPPALATANLGATMLLQVHDELLFEVPDDEVEATVACVKQVMETACAPVLTLSVPLTADAGVAPSWMDAH